MSNSKIKLKSSSSKSVTIEVTIPLSKSMLQTEEGIRDALNEVGCVASQSALNRFDADGTALIMGDSKLTSKGKVRKTYQTMWGEVDVDRHVYQSSKGGHQFCPLERDARIVLTSTPGFTKWVTAKYAQMGSSQVLSDLKESHGRKISRPYLKHLCDAVGSVALAKEELWDYELPVMPKPLGSVGVGIDGTCMLLVEDGWREAMVGTISLYDKKGKRMHTIQVGATPQYGKEKFYSKFERELESIKKQFPNTTYIGIADGAKGNWEYLKDKTDEQTIDFWHATEYLGKASGAMFFGDKKKLERKEWLDAAYHKLKHNIGAATRLLNEMKEFKEEHRLRQQEKSELRAAITYFENNRSKMRYAKSQNQNWPIGSGVTEAACKTLIKQRLCNSGMRWKEKGAASVISLRSMAHTDYRWDQFWGKIDQFGYPIAS